jgi:F0F1-type ATP synthase assembly protein I
LRAPSVADIIAAPMSRPPGGAWGGFSTAWAVTGTLVAGIGVWGGLGYLADRLFGFRWLFLPIGMIIGVAAGIYLVYVRYGRENRET